MPVKQSAHRQFHCTETAVTKVLNELLMAADEGNESTLSSQPHSSIRQRKP